MSAQLHTTELHPPLDYPPWNTPLEEFHARQLFDSIVKLE